MAKILSFTSDGVRQTPESTPGDDDTTSGGSGGNGGDMDHKEYTDLKVGELAAQVQASHDRLATKFDLLASKLPSKNWLIVNSLVVVGLIIAALALWAGGYTGGFGASSAHSNAIADQNKRIEDAERADDARAARIEAAIDGLIRRMDEQR